MVVRLVLGTGALGRKLLSTLERQGEEVLVVVDDEHRLDTLNSRDVRVKRGDPGDVSVLRSLDLEPDSVLVDAADGEANGAVVQAARRAFPDALILTYAGWDPGIERREALTRSADEVVEPARTVAVNVLERIDAGAGQSRRLRRVLRDIDGKLAIVTHDNPDPDAIASAVALERIASDVGCPTDICYYGEISHQENRAFVNVLDFDLENLTADADLSNYDGFALVDHSRPGVNDRLPGETPVDVVIDHHPPRGPIEAKFVEIRSDVGATSTLLADHLRRHETLIDETVATGLLFGIRIDTDEFRREVAVDDFEAAAYLLPHADLDTLQRIEAPSVTTETLETIGRAIENRIQEGTVLLSCVGEVTDRDALAQAADQLLNIEDVTTTVVYGVLDGTIYVSARARGTDVDLGGTLRDAFGQIGSAGGHADMAGAQITLGVLERIEDHDKSLHEIVRAVVDDRFLETLESRSNQQMTSVYPGSVYGPIEEFVERRGTTREE